jgi:ABC-type uncharacterized transport system permease subunit
VSPLRILAFLKILLLCCWPPAAWAATLTFDQALAQITLRESLLLCVLMTLAGVTALLFRISNQVNAGIDGDVPMKPIRSLPLLVSAHMCGSWLAGICAFFLASHFDMPGLMVGFFVPMVSFGGAKSLELMYNKFVADRMASRTAAGGST